MPAGVPLLAADVDRELARRQQGYGRGRRMQIETDQVEFLSGVRAGETLGSPIAMLVRNRDWRNWEDVMDPAPRPDGEPEQRRRAVTRPRPGHADLTGVLKYDRDDARDILERASARETTARVAAGALARMLLAEFGVEIRSGVRSLGPIGADRPVPTWEDLLQVDETSPLRAIDRALEPEMVRLVEQAKEEGDTLGGAVTVIAHNVPVGLGSHVQWDEKLDGRLAQAILSVHAVKAVEIGSGLEASRGFGSAAHDPIERTADGRWTRPTNRAGGLEGGVTNGEDLVITAYKKPIATLRKGMPSVDLDTLEPHASQYERSDVTALPAAGVIAEAMVALVLADALLEKLGGDSMAEVRAHWETTLAQQRAWPGGVRED
jgi:chorismate synthase